MPSNGCLILIVLFSVIVTAVYDNVGLSITIMISWVSMVFISRKLGEVEAYTDIVGYEGELGIFGDAVHLLILAFIFVVIFYVLFSFFFELGLFTLNLETLPGYRIDGVRPVPLP